VALIVSVTLIGKGLSLKQTEGYAIVELYPGWHITVSVKFELFVYEYARCRIKIADRQRLTIICF